MIELLQDAHFWVGVALVIFLGLLGYFGVHKILWTMLGERGAKVQAQLDEASKLRAEAETLLSQIKAQREAAEKQAAAMLENAKEEAIRLGVEAKVKLDEQIKRRAALAERKIATAQAQAEADVKAAAADLATSAAETVLAARIAGAKSDPLIDAAVKTLAQRLQ